MKLVVLVGNTNIKLAYFQMNRLSKFERVFTHDARRITFQKNLSEIIYASVVPNLNIKFPLNPRIITSKDIPLKYASPYLRQAGIDRLLNVYGANYFYHKPCLVVDSGTALTFSFIDAKGVFMGGFILPGEKLSFQSLFSGTALLPEVRSKKVTTFKAGINTIKAINDGIHWGMIGQIKTISQLFKEKYGDYKLIITGGNGKKILPFIPELKPKYDEFLQLNTLNIL